MKYYWVFSLVWLALSSAHATTVYSSTDAQGNINYSDTPTKNSRIMQVPTGGTISAPKTILPENKTSAPGTPTIAPAIETKNYNKFAISSPKNNETFQNTRAISVDFAIDPALQKGDFIIIKVDGTLVGSPENSIPISVNNLERGTHIVAAQIIRNNEVVATSNSVTIFVHYANLGVRPNGNSS